MSDYKFKPNSNDKQLVEFMESQGLTVTGEQSTNTAAKDANKDLDLQGQFIKQLVDARLQRGMSQTVLAQKASTPQSALARIEAGKGNPTLKTLTKLADTMGYKLTLLRKQD